MNAQNNPILLFDGVCNLCNGSVRFILKRDRKQAFRFAPLQSAAGQALLERLGLPRDGFRSVVLVEGDRHYQRSAAALRILRALGWPYKALYVFILIPRPLRDFGYDLIARNRYRVFGRSETCMVPTPEIRERFLS
ncbi:MAG: putative thiol-disulfide oxidoreductase YuxK, family [Fibrobacteres bacterium]|nr:putative thiol-disulfide oxidoreductase YuxK, family [Fibrobacterota bacterium]